MYDLAGAQEWRDQLELLEGALKQHATQGTRVTLSLAQSRMVFNEFMQMFNARRLFIETEGLLAEFEEALDHSARELGRDASGPLDKIKETRLRIVLFLSGRNPYDPA